MFIGGLNWETTDQTLKDYFEQFGQVLECTVMRDGATGRSRGFGFLTFKDPKTVNIVMLKEHHLDGKIIDPKRAIPREEQERTAKIFVGGVSQECTEQQFKDFFAKFGRVIDATLMMDKDTGRPRGFGFVTFDGDDAVDRTLNAPLQIHGKPIEVKRAEPRGNMNEDNKGGNKFNRRGGGNFQGRGNDHGGQYDGGNDQSQFQNGGGAQSGGQGGAGGTSNMSQAQMAQYWFKMQEYFRNMQQMMAAQQQQGQAAAMNPAMMGQMNPAMMQQMMAMQQQRMMSPGGTPMGAGVPAMGGPGGSAMGPGGPMSPASMAQMQQMQSMQAQMMQGGGPGGQQPGYGGASPGGGAAMGRSLSGNRPAFNAQEQLVFEQQKYERQQAARMQQQQYAAQHGQFAQGGPTAWEGMYDDVPQPGLPPAGPRSNHGGNARGGGHGHKANVKSQSPAVNAPANAPTGPKNAGGGGNYRGGRGGGRGRGNGGGGFHPYGRPH
ncbi:RNA-binding domain-containing protein [Tothia fuscella]|uniref:RNA-binding domain-containing protein n=1 Tax=Tothia fuscella TaxID=1048955 RepID=A0A9P4U2P2_9PEZI|nr:RNA-binding domain-containing protein [Tothia fuscella]